ncbi:MAG: TIGR00725 family protein [Candidatus Aminicenantes bacterium]|nr:TIGR00725 family protein [Candidatus Aminicenantes bacterium]
MSHKEIRSLIRIGVIGGSRAKTGFLAQAREVGRLIADRGAVLVCGGLGGVMEEAARGARSRGGLTIGILPGTQPSEANPHIDVALATGLGYTRNSLVAMNADVLIAIDGEYGTLSEIAYARIYGKTVIGLGTWEVKGVVPAASPEEAVRLAVKAVPDGR